MGLTFKEDCPDIRNTKVVDIVKEFKTFECNVDVYDPWVDKSEALNEYGINPINKPMHSRYDAIIIAVAHKEFKNMSADKIRAFGKKNSVIFDIKHLLDENEVDGRL